MHTLFLHIPRTGGTTLRDIIHRQYNQDSILTIADLETCREFLFNELKNRSKTLSVIEGHFYFGIHDILPHESKYITMIRNPVEHIISGYYYLHRSPYHALYDSVVKSKMSLSDYITSGINPIANNPQVRILTGKGLTDRDGIPYGKCPESMLENAIENLNKHFAAIGITNRFDESVLLFKKVLRWSSPFYSKANATKNRPQAREISAETIEIIKQYNDLDMQLFKWANRHMDQQLDKYLPKINRQVSLFNLSNKLMGKIMVYPRLIRYYQFKIKPYFTKTISS